MPCRFNVHGQAAKRSTVKANTGQPKWDDESFEFLIHDEKTETLLATLYDHDRFSKDDALAR
jgi:hypothetical protein